jgi:hypothetical protein
MRHISFLCLVIFALAIPVVAQDSPVFENGYSYLKVTQDRVTLTVCAENIVPGTYVYAVAFRDAVSADVPSRSWGYVIYADDTSLMSLTGPSGFHYDHQCVLFDGYPDERGVMMGMEDSGPTFPNTDYYTQATLDVSLGFERGSYVEEWGRDGCYIDTEGHGLCDMGTSLDFVRGEAQIKQ